MLPYLLYQVQPKEKFFGRKTPVSGKIYRFREMFSGQISDFPFSKFEISKKFIKNR